MASKLSKYLNTSVDNCRVSLGYVFDRDLLRDLLAECVKLCHTSRAAVVRTRIRHLERSQS